ncbi:NAD(P)H-dependent oxidoreductase [Caulobacter sp.]|uniref:NAD(P)H-dependent oxidoreductase n=1 Tax=Caulobacter sp. TaxID=78 RepID=UPI001AFEC5F1|nr:NAD(P)H-dependent oxidoreductase [Caulobacter sp.]MBO9547564.1 NAD(P)H-dependent oxidoreductase [Caulobacter sp.]
MHALVVLSHPVPGSLTHAVAEAVSEGVSGQGHTFEIADLAAEGFDAAFAASDIDAHLRRAAPSAAVLAEQARLDRANALVLVYPVYWWSMPGLLKGWIDRVFANGWAYEERGDGTTEKKLGRLAVHLVAIGGADLRTYARHGYFGAMRTQIDHGIFGYCGAPVVTSELLTASEPPAAHLERARAIGQSIFTHGRAREAA